MTDTSDPIPTPAPTPAPHPTALLHPILIGTPPAPPAEGADWQAWDIYLRRVALINDLLLRQRSATASEAHGAAQADTAAAMREAVAAQTGLALELAKPAPERLPRRADIVLQVAERLPPMTGLTDLQIVDLAIQRVDAWLRRFPGAAT